MKMGDTIFAMSSGRLPAGVAVVRISGPAARLAIETIAGSAPEPYRLAVRTLRRGSDGEIIDTGLVGYFQAPRSFTGEDCAEFHVHGGRAVVSALFGALGEIDGVRAAEAGEFTHRAFLNGKMDLVQAEALGDLIEAETETQRRMAIRTANGHISRLYEGWRARILAVQAAIAADIDFGDEGDVPDSVAERVGGDIAEVRIELERHLAAHRKAEMIREGYQVVLVGPPNSGKSSLLNALAGRDVAIVTDEPGTTRDLIEVQLDLGGLKVVVTDTAGLREGAGRVEQMGIERAMARAEAADLVVELRPADAEDGGQPQRWRDAVIVRSKSDLSCRAAECGDGLAVSTVTGEGLDRLVEMIRERAESAVGNGWDVGPQRLRHRLALQRCAKALSRAESPGLDLELIAEDLRSAATELGRVTGRIEVEDILGEVFKAFCIGK
ncbi:MAG TPA: tRNA uridine-5-carboxymethylaminomethyl(34) synthesis GTPase MnmE [Rhizobiales bacterium]|nr:tRNA uridine-5-carboxymethylaminomethyl(34) synthesis GTPase MnmE [Hyphomicrobiales bacterium]